MATNKKMLKVFDEFLISTFLRDHAETKALIVIIKKTAVPEEIQKILEYKSFSRLKQISKVFRGIWESNLRNNAKLKDCGFAEDYLSGSARQIFEKIKLLWEEKNK